MSGTRTCIVERGRAICSVAVSATLLSVPVIGLGPVQTAIGHRDRGSSGAAAHAAPAPAVSQAPQFSVRPQQGPGDGVAHAQNQGNGYGHDQGNGNAFGHDQGNGNAFGHDQGNGNAFGHDQGNGNGNGPGGPPGGDFAHGHGRGLAAPPAASPQQSSPTPPAPAPAPALAPAPSMAANQGNGQGNGGGNGHANGPFAAHGSHHDNGVGNCGGLCRGGQNAGLSPSTQVSVPAVAVAAPPTPVPATPVTITPTAPAPSAAPIPSTPPLPVIIPTLPTPSAVPHTTAPPSFSSSSSARPVRVAGAAGRHRGAGAGAALIPAFGGTTALPLLGTGLLTPTASGFGTLAPSTAALLGTPAAANTSGAAATTTGSRATGHHTGGSHGGGTTILFIPHFIPHFINHIPEGVWIALAAALALAALGAGAAVISRRRANAQAGELAAVAAAALTDPLTGVLNRRGFIEAVERELARARRYHHPFVLAYVDVRGLKTVNDTEGHLTGDSLLKTVAALLTDCARADDVVGRLGGDELGLLLVEQSPEAAKVVTQRIAAQVAAKRKSMNLAVPWDLTVGSAAFPQDGQTVDELLGTADRRLYQQRGIRLASSR